VLEELQPIILNMHLPEGIRFGFGNVQIIYLLTCRKKKKEMLNYLNFGVKFLSLYISDSFRINQISGRDHQG